MNLTTPFEGLVKSLTYIRLLTQPIVLTLGNLVKFSEMKSCLLPCGTGAGGISTTTFNQGIASRFFQLTILDSGNCFHAQFSLRKRGITVGSAGALFKLFNNFLIRKQARNVEE